MRCFVRFCCLLAATAPGWASAGVLYSTSFEESQGFTVGEGLSTTLVQTSDPTSVPPNSWFHVGDVINNATVTSNLANSGSQSVKFTDNTRVMLAGPWSAPIVDFEYSFFIEGPDTFGDPDVDGIFNLGVTPVGPFRFALTDGQRRYYWVGSSSTWSSDGDDDGEQELLDTRAYGPAETRPTAFHGVNEWNKVNQIFNTVDQTMELRLTISLWGHAQWQTFCLITALATSRSFRSSSCLR